MSISKPNRINLGQTSLPIRNCCVSSEKWPHKFGPVLCITTKLSAKFRLHGMLLYINFTSNFIFFFFFFFSPGVLKLLLKGPVVEGREGGE